MLAFNSKRVVLAFTVCCVVSVYSGGDCNYKGVLYTTGQNWQDGCQYKCTCENGVGGQYYCTQLCATWSSLPQNCVLQKLPSECCANPVCSGGTGTGSGPGGSATGTGGNGTGGTGTGGTGTGGSGTGGTGDDCYYRGRLYKTGQNWKDGCQYKCTCKNGDGGQYFCTQLCATWSSLPQGCVLQKPPGECCALPVCSGSTGTGSGSGGSPTETGGTGTGGTGTG